MNERMYVRCGICAGSGRIVTPVGAVADCDCVLLYVRPTDHGADVVRVLERELTRRSLRIAGLERQLREREEDVERARTQPASKALDVADMVAWWYNAAPQEQVAFTEATGLRYGGAWYIQLTPRDLAPPERAAEGG